MRSISVEVITTGRLGALSGTDGVDGGMVGARSSTIITARDRVGALSRADGMDGGTVGARSGMMGTVSWMKSMASRRMGTTSWMMGMASRADGHGRGHDGGEQREICGAQRGGCEGGCGVGELQLWYTPY